MEAPKAVVKESFVMTAKKEMTEFSCTGIQTLENCRERGAYLYRKNARPVRKSAAIEKNKNDDNRRCGYNSYHC